MEKIQEYKKDLMGVKKEILILKDEISFMKIYFEDYQNNETYKKCIGFYNQLLDIQTWLENKLK